LVDEGSESMVGERSSMDGMMGHSYRGGMDGMVGYRGNLDSMDSVVTQSISVVSGVVTHSGYRDGVVKGGRGVDGVSNRSSMDSVGYRGTVVHCWVLTDDSLVFHVGMVLLVLVHDVIDNLGPAVGQIHSVLTLDDAPLSGLGLGVNVGVSVSIKLVNVVAVRVVMRDDIVNCVNGMDSWCCVNSMNSMNSRGCMNGMVKSRGCMDYRGYHMMGSMMGHWDWSCHSMVSWMNSMMRERGSCIWSWSIGGCMRRKAQRNLGNGGCHQGGDAQDDLHAARTLCDCPHVLLR